MVKVASMDELDLLLIQAQAGDLDAFEMIIQHFQDMAVGYAYSILGDFHLAQDAAQEAFIEAYLCLGKVYSIFAFPAWFRKIIYKNCDRITRKTQPQLIQLEQAIQIPSEDENPLEKAEMEEIRQIVLSAVMDLPEDERAVTNLFYINGYSYDEIGTFLDVPITTVDNRLRSAKKRLKRKMINLVKDTLHPEQPSKDQKFTNKVQLYNAIEVKDMEKIKELLSTDEVHKALYDFLKTHAEEQGITVEEFVVWVIQQYKEQVDRDEKETEVFRKTPKSKEKQGALLEIEGYYKEAKFNNGAILMMARLIPQARHNVSIIIHIAYLASKFGYHTGPLMDIARLAASCDHECGELGDIADRAVLNLGESYRVSQLAQFAVYAKNEDEKEFVRQTIEKLKASADYKSIEEGLEAQSQQHKEEIERAHIFQKGISQDKQEALHTIQKYLMEANFHDGAIYEIANLIPKAEHNLSVITRSAYLASKFGYHTKPLIDIARLAATSDHECKELLDIIDFVVLKLSETLKTVQVAESAVKAKSEEEKKQVRQEIEKIKATADYKSIEEGLKAQDERNKNRN